MTNRRAPAYVGLMSGTSLDGISAAVARFAPNDGGFDTELVAFVVTPYTDEQRERLRRSLVSSSTAEYCRLGFDLGAWLARAAVAVMAESGLPRDEIRAIGSHGQTLWHEPGHSTWQIGEAAVIAERTGVAVVSDFRVRDVAAHGQGAPLVPIADALLFSGGRWRALQNLGGIGNVTVVPPNGDLRAVRAFDTGPGVAVIDGVVNHLAPELPYDVDGRLASSGTVVDDVVAELLKHPYFDAEPPKSTGRELFDAAYVEHLISRCREARPACTTADIVATATALTARSIAHAYRRFLPEPVEEVLVSGGGAKNPALVAMLRAALEDWTIVDFAERYFDGEAKEAVAFALLAHLHMEGKPGNVPSATGARGARVLGKLTPP